jgi:hypothetical protein
MDWTAIGLIGFAAFLIADLPVFRFVFPPHSAENTMMRFINGLSWVLAVFLLLVGLEWIFL